MLNKNWVFKQGGALLWALVCLVFLSDAQAQPPHSGVSAILGDAGYIERYGHSPTDQVDEVKRIQAHFAHVEEMLAGAPTSHLSSAQRQERRQALKRLAQYRARGKFPKNSDESRRRPVFIDEEGTLCAVGHLVAESFGRDLAEEINQQQQLSYISEMPKPLVNKLSDRLGLSPTELALIQPTYQKARPHEVLSQKFVKELQKVQRRISHCDPRVTDFSEVKLSMYFGHHWLIETHSNDGPGVGDRELALRARRQGFELCLRAALKAYVPAREFRWSPLSVRLAMSQKFENGLKIYARRRRGLLPVPPGPSRRQFRPSPDEILSVLNEEPPSASLAACMPPDQVQSKVGFQITKKGTLDRVNVYSPDLSISQQKCVETALQQVHFEPSKKPQDVLIALNIDAQAQKRRSHAELVTEFRDAPGGLSARSAMAMTQQVSTKLARCFKSDRQPPPVIEALLKIDVQGHVLELEELVGGREKVSMYWSQCFAKELKSIRFSKQKRAESVRLYFEITPPSSGLRALVVGGLVVAGHVQKNLPFSMYTQRVNYGRVSLHLFKGHEVYLDGILIEDDVKEEPLRLENGTHKLVVRADGTNQEVELVVHGQDTMPTVEDGVLRAAP